MSDLGWKHLRRADKRAMLRGVRDGVAYGGPYHVEIHPADRCNIDCFFCSTAAIRGTDELPVQRFTELIDELRELGTRAIRFSGGGEPLFHRKIKDVLRAIHRSGIPIENITTNAILLDEETAKLLTLTCDQVTVSLNTSDAESYASMMQTPARNFERALANIRRLVKVKREQKSRRPSINLQYLVWRGNYRQIPRMYELARELEVDTILFSGLSLLRPDQRMTADELDEMMELYEAVIRKDEFRRIANIGSFELDLSPRIDALIGRLSDERRRWPLAARIRAFASREGSLRDKIAHHLRMRANARADRATADFDSACVIGWYSLLIRSNGSVAPCCFLQHKSLDNIMARSVREIWHGEEFATLRQELTAIIRRGAEWQHTNERAVEGICAVAGTDLCPMKSFYFIRDTSFVSRLGDVFARHRRALSA